MIDSESIRKSEILINDASLGVSAAHSSVPIFHFTGHEVKFKVSAMWIEAWIVWNLDERNQLSSGQKQTAMKLA